MPLLPKNIPNQIIGTDKMRVWVMGAAGEGKTTFATTFPNAILLNTDGNYKQFSTPYIFLKDIMKMPNGTQKTGWDYFKDVIDEFISNNDGYQTLIVDLLEDVIKFCDKSIAQKAGKKMASEVPWGKGNHELKEEVKNILTLLNSIDMNIVYLSHSVPITQKNINGVEITCYQPKELKNEMIQMIAGRVQIMAALETITQPRIENGLPVMEFGRQVYDSFKILNWEKSDRLPSVVNRFNTLQTWCFATYNDLMEVITNGVKR